ncbi:HU family DNA-binding protein [Bacteroides stercorirosoris]|jgi:predicted histone-like DNA-binding protein|uniref:DNA-binding protein n=1 Tax=Bacteroides stercorirosoris TaxID=871324 RepID=A0A1M6B8Z9_9BACE|nr:HU family DNA-binding protein [Bacteroides stercorirosoris]OKZ10869.1 MAG: DNA-binding protein [Bacteroides oleiciplenus]RGX80232.1 DNA-binding protein [Bacteroides stercorirosoris]SHI44943.1 DNA-binding protein, histone-like, putative [Bacteroides stercorirosoris]
MTMNYVVRKKVDKSKGKAVVRYYAASKVLQPEPVSNEEIAKRLAEISSLQVGDAQSVLVQLPDIIADFLASGRTVNIRGLGNFFPAITSEPVERVEDCTADKVRISRICFKAAGSFVKRIYKNLDLFSFQVRELKKEQKKKEKE